MDKAPRPFQIGLYFGFGLLMFAALILLMTFQGVGSSDESRVGPVTIWGTVDASVMNRRINEFRNVQDQRTFQQVQYRQIREEVFNTELVNAIAEQRQPDVVIIPNRLFIEHRNLLVPISYERISRRAIQDTFIDGFDLYTRSNGLYALPFGVDPLIMYWNRDIFATNGFSQAPQTWEEIVNSIVPTVVRRTVDRRVTMSPVALGYYENNRNAFALLSTLLLQSGSRMVTEQNGNYSVELNTALPGGQPNPLVATVNFFTRFGNPSDTLYTWNRTKRQDRQEFLSGDLAIYFGLGSEYGELRQQNPNLNFDVARIPQSADATIQRTYADFYGMSILQSARNPNGAFQVVQELAMTSNLLPIVTELNLAPPHRSLIGAGSSAPVEQVIYSSALVARGWLNPRWQRTDDLFLQMISDVQSGRNPSPAAARDTVLQLRRLY